jgi:putative endonuclease
MYYTYILFSQRLGKFYVGHSQDLDARLQYHNAGNVQWTSLGTPWALAYQESFPSKAEAARRERQIKNWKSAKAVRQLIDGAKT